MWEGPPTDKDERSGKVKDTGGSFLGEKKGLKGGKLENCRRMPVHPVSASRGGEGDAVVGKWGRLRQKGLMRRGERANQSSGGKGSDDRSWKGLGWANREAGAGVVGLSVMGLVGVRLVGLVLSCLVMFCLILSCWAGERDGDKKLLDGAEERGAYAAVTEGKDQDTEREVPVPLRTQGTLCASDVRSAAGKAGARMSSLA